MDFMRFGHPFSVLNVVNAIHMENGMWIQMDTACVLGDMAEKLKTGECELNLKYLYP